MAIAGYLELFGDRIWRSGFCLAMAIGVKGLNGDRGCYLAIGAGWGYLAIGAVNGDQGCYFELFGDQS